MTISLASRAATFTLLLLLATDGIARAQETTTGSIRGQVVDAQKLGIPGATVTVSADQGDRSYVTDENGRFFAPYLTPGRYTVRAELQGFRPVAQSGIDVRLGQRLDVILVMEVGDINEEVQVSAAPPVVDTSSTTAGARLDSETINSIPVGRRFTDVLYVAPGVSSGGGSGAANASMSGGSGLENNYILDGVNISDTGYGAAGSYSTRFKTLGNAITFDFIDEIEVKTAGFEAEFGQSTGGIVNVVTKSGSNSIRGSLFAYSQPDALESDYDRIVTANGTVNTTGISRVEAGFTVGGPALRDRLFYFGAVNPQYEDASLLAPPGFALESLGEVPRERRTISYSAKVTYQAASGHRFDASFFGDPSRGDNGPQREAVLTGIDTAGFSSIRYGGNNQTIRYDGLLASHWFVEASIGRASHQLREIPSVDEWVVIDRTVVPNIRSGGIGAYEQDSAGQRLQYQAKSTHVFGNHQIRYGVIAEDIDFDAITQTTGPTFVLPNGQRTVTGATVSIQSDPVFGRIYAVTGARTENVRETTQLYLSAFLQDTFRIGNRITVRPGVRWDQQKLVGVGREYTFTGNWAPRVGATFDPTGTGRSKLFVNYGRFYTQFPNDLASRGLSALSAAQAEYFDAGLTQPVPDGVLAAGRTIHYRPSGANPAEVYPGSKATYKDEWLAGGEYELVRGLRVGARYIHRDLENVLEDIAPAATILYDLGVATGIVFFIGNPSDGFPPTLNNVGAFETPIQEYDAVEVFADRRFADNWSLQTSYRWSRLSGTYEGFYRNDNNQSDPALTSLFDLPMNDPTYTEIGVPQFGYRGDIRYLGRLGAGPLPNDRRHQVKLSGNYRFTNGLNLGLRTLVSSGRPLTAFAASPVTGNAGNIPEGPRGSGIESVDGFRTRTPVEFAFDLHGDYGIPIGERRILLVADVFNVFNLQRPLMYDSNTESRVRIPNPDYGARTVIQDPRQVRLGIRFDF